MAGRPDEHNDEHDDRTDQQPFGSERLLIESTILTLAGIVCVRASSKNMWLRLVLATDFSPVAVHVQRGFAALAPEAMFEDWPSFIENNAPFERPGRFEVTERFHDRYTEWCLLVVINCRAFQGLSLNAMLTSANNFFAALRPGGAAIIDTMNVQRRTRDVLVNSLMDARFFLPFSVSERWCRAQLDGTGIICGIALGRPHIPHYEQYPADHFASTRSATSRF
jgi:hypothetical protein